jgi:hypothetical protein
MKQSEPDLQKCPYISYWPNLEKMLSLEDLNSNKRSSCTCYYHDNAIHGCTDLTNKYIKNPNYFKELGLTPPMK